MRLNEKCVSEYCTSSAPTDKEGYLNKKGEVNRGYQRRWFILKGNLLYYFEKRSDKEPIGVIVLDNCHVELAESGEPYAFQITFGGDGSRTYILGADSAKEMESWMRSITHSNYECLRMMVESFESTLQKLTSEENELSSSANSSNVNPNSIDSLSSASDYIGNGNIVDKSDAKASVIERPVPKVAQEFRTGNGDSLDSFFLQPSGEDFAATEMNANSDMTVLKTEPVVGNLVSLDDDSDDDQIPIQSEFSLNEGFYAFSQHSTDIMPLSYSDIGRLEDMHAEDLFNRLSGNIPPRSRDDSDLMSPVKHDPLPRNLRPKSERRRNNIRTVYENAEGLRFDRGKSKTLRIPRPSSDQDITGYHLEHNSVFRYLHELYSASIWVKCKEFGKQAALKPL